MLWHLPQTSWMGSRFGLAFKLRNQGHYAESLSVALQLFERAHAASDPMIRHMMVSAAGLVDEVAQKSGRPQLARRSLVEALEYIQAERMTMKSTDRDGAYWKHLDSFESQFRSRLRDMAHGAAPSDS